MKPSLLIITSLLIQMMSLVHASPALILRSPKTESYSRSTLQGIMRPEFKVREINIPFHNSMVVKALIAHPNSPHIQLLSISPSGKRYLVAENINHDTKTSDAEYDLCVYDRESQIQKRIHMPRYSIIGISWSPSERCILNFHELVDLERGVFFELGETSGFMHWSRTSDQVVYQQPLCKYGVQFMAARTSDNGLAVESISLQQATELLGEAFPKIDEALQKVYGKAYYRDAISAIRISPDGKKFLVEGWHKADGDSGNVRLDTYISYLINKQRILIKQEKIAMEFITGDRWLDAHRWIFGYEPLDEEFGLGGANLDDRRCGLWDTVRNKISWRKIPQLAYGDLLLVLPFNKPGMRRKMRLH